MHLLRFRAPVFSARVSVRQRDVRQLGALLVE